MAKKNSKKRKVTASDHRAQLAKARQNPAFRKQERLMRLQGEFSLEYISRILKGQDVKAHVAENADVLEELEGLDTIHNFLEYLECVTHDYEDHFDEDGILKRKGLNSEAVKFVDQYDEDLRNGNPVFG